MDKQKFCLYSLKKNTDTHSELYFFETEFELHVVTTHSLQVGAQTLRTKFVTKKRQQICVYLENVSEPKKLESDTSNTYLDGKKD